LAAYWRAIALDGGNANLFRRIGRLHEECNHWSDAAEAYCVSLARQPYDNSSVDRLFDLDVIVEFVGLRRRLRRKSSARSADSPDRQKGDQCRDRHKWQEAARFYSAHVLRHPRDADIWVQRGNCLKEAGAHNLAVKSYERALELRDDDVDAYFQMGLALKRWGAQSEAIAAFRKSIWLQPRNNPAVRELSDRGLSTGTLRVVVPMHGRLDRIVHSGARRQADREFSNLRWRRAAECYLAHLAEFPQDDAVWLLAARALKRSRAYGYAMSACWRVLAREPDNVDCYEELAELYALMGRRTEAAGAREAAFKRRSTGPLELSRRANKLREQLHRLRRNLRLVVASETADQMHHPLVALTTEDVLDATGNTLG
jgi:tetratricopeptide (TPR) repeat protein